MGYGGYLDLMGQPRLRVDRDTLDYIEDGGFVFWNEGDSLLVVNGIAISQYTLHAFTLDITTKDSTQQGFYVNSAYDQGRLEFEKPITLNTNDSAEVLITGYDPCIACKNTSLAQGDTLWIYSNDPTFSHILIDLMGYVGNEREPREITSSWEINLYPNPARTHTNLAIIGSEAAIHEVELYDLLGRRVFVDKMAQLHNKDYELEIDVSVYAAGMYILSVKRRVGIWGTNVSQKSAILAVQ